MNPYVSAMVVVRLLSAAIELTAAYLMARANRVDTALRLNALLGLVGPTILIVVSLIGLGGLADRISPGKLLLIAGGVFLIVLGTR